MVNLELVALKVKCDRQYQTIIKLQDEKIDLFKETQQLKEVIEEVRERVKQVASCPYADFDIETKEGSYQVSISKWLDDILQILDKVKV